MSRALGLLLASIQTALGVRVVWRLWRTGREVPIRAVPPRAITPGVVAVVVPVLNEAHRLAPCLEGLLAQGTEVGEILIVDGGSPDGTRDVPADRPARDGARLPGPAMDVLAVARARCASWIRSVAQCAAAAPPMAWSNLYKPERTDRRLMRLARALLLGHATALVFGLAGMLIALPHPELWSASPLGQQAFAFGMQYAGPLHMVLGAAAMLAFGGAVLGLRRTLLFFGLACCLSLASELIGTGTGYPFGNYEYTSGLGYKILGRVPFSIPLSWFYMGLASYLLGGTLARWHPVWSVGLGAYFLTVWDLVLDPAMAHPSLALNFWIWHQSGPYFGMPVQNFLGWTATGALFMGLSRWLWGATVLAVPARFPLGVYALNMVFAMVLSAAGGVWPPIGLAVACALGGAALAVRGLPTGRLAPRAVT